MLILFLEEGARAWWSRVAQMGLYVCPPWLCCAGETLRQIGEAPTQRAMSDQPL